MKKVINGRMYDTGTAKKLASWNNGRYGNDFGACSEVLYVKRTGEYFLHGEGGALSPYAVHNGNNSGGGERIIPFDFLDAKKWVEEHCDGEVYEGVFGIVVEEFLPSRQEQISLVLPADILGRLRSRRDSSGVAVQTQILKALRDYLV